MRIALISTPFVAVPPPRYGGTELIVYHLARELAERGHEVLLYATADSAVPGVEVRALCKEAVWPPEPWLELDHATFAMRDLVTEPVDIIHAHVAPALSFVDFVDAPVVYTLHHVRDEPLQSYYAHRQSKRLRMVAISERQRDLFAPEVPATVVHHGLDPRAYALGPGGSYAAFLGRFALEKGVHLALDAAYRSGVPIRLAGQPHWKDRAYYEAELASRLERPGVSWLGEADHQTKCALLGGARATLVPIDWEEPFGLVMVESMLCGAPVLAFPRGAAPEIIDDGVTGWLCSDIDEMAWRLRQLSVRPFDRRACRARAAARFNVARMVDRYIDLYASAIDHPVLTAVSAELA